MVLWIKLYFSNCFWKMSEEIKVESNAALDIKERALSEYCILGNPYLLWNLTKAITMSVTDILCTISKWTALEFMHVNIRTDFVIVSWTIFNRKIPSKIHTCTLERSYQIYPIFKKSRCRWLSERSAGVISFTDYPLTYDLSNSLPGLQYPKPCAPQIVYCRINT